MTPSIPLALALVLLTRVAHGTEYLVAAAGGDFTSVQAALDVAVAGDTVTVRSKPTPYVEKVTFPRSGSAGAGYITLRAFPGEEPVLDGTGVPGDNMVLIDHRSYVKVIGLELRNNLGVTDGSGVRVLGAGSHVEIRQNRIHDMRGQNAMGITVYGTDPTAISDLIIDGNEISDCEPAPSEALTLNGNVTDFAVTNNIVRDVDNIGIDFIGGETDIQPDPTKVARSGVCRGNQVIRARSSYGGGFAGGIYVDGGRDLVIENNLVTESDLGIEIGAENAGIVTQNVTVRNNLIVRNEKAGLVFGGFASSVGRVRNSTFTNNTCWQNDTLAAGFGELWIQYAEDNVVRNNIFVSTSQNLLLLSEGGNVNNVLDYNLWFTVAGSGAAQLVWNGTLFPGFAAYRAGTGQDGGSVFADPVLISPGAGDFHLGPGSPAVNAGAPTFAAGVGEVDLDGGARVNGPRVDLGADESTVCGNGIVETPETCDDGNPTSGDGCDANCTPTGCGNAVVTAGEQCDDGNLAAGDCCGPTCQRESDGTPCDDGDACTPTDTCSAGTCAGTTTPATGCRTAAAGSLLVKPAAQLLVWKWTRGASTASPEFGNPAGGQTGYVLCVYDTSAGTPSLAFRATAPAGGSCRGKPCWKTSASGTVSYTDKDGTPEGLVKLTLKPSAFDQTKITARAKGGNAVLPALPLSQTPALTVQLRQSGAGPCWESVFASPATLNDGTLFRDAMP